MSINFLKIYKKVLDSSLSFVRTVWNFRNDRHFCHWRGATATKNLIEGRERFLTAFGMTV